MPMKRQNWRVLIDISEDQFISLISALGYAVGAAIKDDERDHFRSWIRLANAINEGNPNWTPYETDWPQPSGDRPHSTDGMQGAVSPEDDLERSRR